MGTPADEVKHQTAAPEKLIQQIKVYATMNGIFLKKAQEQLVLHFIQDRQKLKDEGKEMVYLAAPTGSKVVHVTLKKELIERVDKIVKIDKTVLARFLYTAMHHFAETHHLDELEVEV